MRTFALYKIRREESEDGARNLPKKGADNRYHIDGNLRMASGKQASKILEKFLPILRLLKKNKKLIFAPLPRYLQQPCCLDKTHCLNRKEEGYLSGMMASIKEIRRDMKDACHEMRVSNYKVVNRCTLLDLSEESDSSSWIEAMGTDPVHLTEAGLTKLADSVLKISESTDSSFSGGKRDLEDDDRSFSLIHGRKPWVYGPVMPRGGGRGGGRGRQDSLRGQRGSGQRGGLGRGLPGPQTGGYNSYGGFGGSKR